MQIRQADTRESRQVAQSVRLPYRLYRGCPYWLPPLVSDAKTLLDEDRHLFYQHSAEVRQSLAAQHQAPPGAE